MKQPVSQNMKVKLKVKRGSF